jgi:hypothetical protein
MEKPNGEGTCVMPVNTIRFERLAFLIVLVGVGIVFKLVVVIRAACSASKELAAMGLRRLDARRGQSRPHSPPAA